MPNTRRAKLIRRQQVAIALAGGLTREELFGFLSEQFRNEKNLDKKTELGLMLLPYLAPRLKAVEVSQTQDVKIKVTIGGQDEAAPAVPASTPVLVRAA